MQLYPIAFLKDTLSSLSKKRGTTLIAIDGCGGAGKTTLADNLLKHMNNAHIVHMDDFYKPSAQRSSEDSQIGASFDWQRLREQVLEPACKGRSVTFQKYDWHKDTLTEWVSINDATMIIVEGVYSSREEIRQCYDYIIWVEATYETRLKRGLERDGEQKRDVWVKEWMPEEDRYIREQSPQSYVDFVIPSD